MAERTTAFMMSQKTQESMRHKLEEWRKAKPQTTNTFSSKTTPFKQTNSQTKRSDIKNTRKSMPYRASSACRPKENNFHQAISKRKSFSATTVSGKTSRPLQKTAAVTNRVKKKTEKPNTNPTNNDGFSQKPPKNFEIEKDPDPKTARRSTFTKEELVFHEKPPQNFEIETEQDEKKARRSTFTTDSPAVPVVEKKEKQPTLREQLEAWRKEKRSQIKPNVTNKANKNVKPVNSKSSSGISSKPQVKRSTLSRTTKELSQTIAKSLPTTNDSSKKVPPRKSLSAIYREKQNKTLPRKNEARKSTSAIVSVPKKNLQPTKQHTTSLKPTKQPPKTPTASRMPPAKTPDYMNKSRSLRERLELWRQEKGITPKPSKTPLVQKKNNADKSRKESFHKKPEIEPIPLQILSPEIIMEEKSSKVVTIATDEIRKELKECLDRINTSNLEEVSCQLDEIHQNANDATLQIAEYWLCKAKIAQDTGDHDRVLCLYQQAIVFNAQPLSLISDEIAAYESKKIEAQHHQQTSTEKDIMQVDTDQELSPCQTAVEQKQPITPHQVADSVFMSPSSTIRYSVTKATPYRSRLNASGRPTVTPVRRSVRLERRSVCYPSVLQDHSITVKHLDELPQDMKEEVSFRPNFAVQSDLNDAWKEIMDN